MIGVCGHYLIYLSGVNRQSTQNVRTVCMIYLELSWKSPVELCASNTQQTHADVHNLPDRRRLCLKQGYYWHH